MKHGVEYCEAVVCVVVGFLAFSVPFWLQCKAVSWAKLDPAENSCGDSEFSKGDREHMAQFVVFGMVLFGASMSGFSTFNENASRASVELYLFGAGALLAVGILNIDFHNPVLKWMRTAGNIAPFLMKSITLEGALLLMIGCLLRIGGPELQLKSAAWLILAMFSMVTLAIAPPEQIHDEKGATQ